MDKKISQLDPAAALDGTELLAVVQGGSTLKSAVSTVKTYLDGYYVPLARTLTINGTSYDLTANRTWNIDTLPAQAGNNGKFLTTDGSTASWGTITQPVWGSITGTLSNQTDLITYVDNNLYKKGGNTFGANVELGTNDAYSLAFRTNNTARISISSTGETGIMVAPSTDARLTIGNGSTTRASLRLMSGSLLTAPISGAIENDGTNLYYTDNTPTRYALLTTATGVTGSGTTNYVPKWTSSNVLGNSLIFDNGTNVGINQSSPTARLHVVGTTSAAGAYALRVDDSSNSPLFCVQNDGTVGIGTISPVVKLQVEGLSYLNGGARITSVGIGGYWGGLANEILTLQATTGNPLILQYTEVGQVGIGTNAPNTSSILDIVSTTKGVLLPRMTTTQRDAINTPATGLKIYNTTTNAFNFYDGSAWVALVSGSFTDTNFANTDLTLTANRSHSLNSFNLGFVGGNVGIGTNNPNRLLSVYTTLTPISTANPDAINLGATFSNLAGSNLKFILYYDDASSQAGFGVSSGAVNYVGYTSGISHKFFDYGNSTYWALFSKNSNELYAGLYIKSTALDTYILRANDNSNNPVLSVKSDGTSGFGTAFPSAKLHVVSTSGTAFRVDGSLTTNNLVVLDDGNVGVGFASPTRKFWVQADSDSRIARFTWQHNTLTSYKEVFSIGSSVGSSVLSISTNNDAVGFNFEGRDANMDFFVSGGTATGIRLRTSRSELTNAQYYIGWKMETSVSGYGSEFGFYSKTTFAGNAGSPAEHYSVRFETHAPTDVPTSVENVIGIHVSKQNWNQTGASYTAAAFIGSVGIGLTKPDASAKLQIDSTTQGVLMPRMTTAQINAIASPANGLMVYNTTIDHVCFYQNGVWQKLSHTNM